MAAFGYSGLKPGPGMSVIDGEFNWIDFGRKLISLSGVA
jgi:hypothetical protein